jgi:hypothetical protein
LWYTTLIAVLLFAFAASAQSSAKTTSVKTFINEAEGMGFEELDEACGDCISPEYLLGKYTELMKKVNPSERAALSKGFKEIIEKQRTSLKESANQNKFIKVTPQKVDSVIGEYLKKIDKVKP